MSAVADWFEEGRKQFVASKIRPDKPPLNYPTQDVNTPKNEADYCLGFRSAQAAWERGEGLSGMESYIAELEEERQQEAQS